MFKWCVSIGLHALWFFAILYLWNTRGIENVKYDSLSASVSILQTILAILALVGFGYISVIAERRSEQVATRVAHEAAEKAAKDVARIVSESMVKSELPALVRREIDELRSVGRLLDEVQTSEGKPQDVINSLDGDRA